MNNPISYSVVVPLKNEEENIQTLIEELEPVMHSLKKPWELICVDDGSTDGTLNTLMSLQSQKPYLRIITFKRNYGQSCAFDAGFKTSKGEYIITMDGDGQNDPQDIPRLLDAIAKADLVCGQRVKRKDPWSKKFISYFANRIRGRLCDDGVKDTGCSLKVYRKACLDRIKLFKGMHRFLPALFKMEGFRLISLPVNHRSRTKGKTKYNIFNRSLNTVADLLAVRWMRKRRLDYEIHREL